MQAKSPSKSPRKPKSSATVSVATPVAHDATNVYIELTKPRITLMVVLTVAIGFALAPPPASPVALLHVLIGTWLSCSGAGALNQLIEQDADSAMARTRFRPLPARRTTPSMVFMIGTLLSVAGVVYLSATTNALTATLNAAILASYLFIYTPMKQWTSVSTLVGAVPGALPPVMGWAAATGRIDLGAWILFAIMFLWQIPHFLAIGRMYRDDYESGGFPMLSVVDAEGTFTGLQMILYSLALVPVSLALCVTGLAGPTYGAVAVLAGLVYLAASAWSAAATESEQSRARARVLLLVSVTYLPILFAALFADRALS